ncbi:patatin-like phospholipase family protein [Candidatus Leptofilum sp.]|uniref:patatin-like phospholipase family protein n=1 Tax=Candidatus Leptofilum sp. TaxID=3241576 RepID=UPI003B5BA3F5
MIHSSGSNAQTPRAAQQLHYRQNWNIAYAGFGRQPFRPKQNNLLHNSLKQAEINSSFITLQQGAWLFRQGELGDAIYFIEKGAVQLVMSLPAGNEQVIDAVPHGTAVGLVAPLTGQWRGVGVRTLTDCVFIRIETADLPSLAKKRPQLFKALQTQVQEQRQLREKCKFLCRYWGTLPTAKLHNWLSNLEWLQIKAGETLFEQGTSPEYIAYVVNGRLQQIHKQLDGQQKICGQIGSGQFAGTLPQQNLLPRHHATVAERDSQLIVLSQENLGRFCEQLPQAWSSLVHDFAFPSHLNPTQQTAARTAHNIAFVPLSVNVPLTELMDELRTAVFRTKNSLILNAQTVDNNLNDLDALLPWLDKQEQYNDYLLYQANPQWDSWSQRCIRQADRIVLVAEANTSPDLTAIEEQIQTLKPQLIPELVLLQPAQGQPQGTANWLASRQVNAHYHVRQGNKQDIRRLGRRLTGQAVGLVLSAGGARGFAHIGAYRALLEAGIEIDYFGGTSMGGLIAAIIAHGYSYEELASFAADYGASSALLDYTFPATSLCASGKITELLRRMFAETRIEDLVLPYFCVSTNLSQAQLKVHQQGRLRRAVRASIAIPGVFAPVSQDGDLLVDGSLISVLPIKLMHQRLNGGQVIAVNATPEKKNSRHWHVDDTISGWKTLYNRLNPFTKSVHLPSLIGTLMQSLYVNSACRLDESKPLANQFIQLSTEEIGMMDWDNYKKLIEIGYRSTKLWYKQDFYATFT